MKTKAVVLLSGGLDSAVTALWAANEGFEPVPLFFNYGQQGAKQERASALYVTRLLGVELQERQLSGMFGAHGLNDSKMLQNPAEDEPVPVDVSAYVPMRNAVFLTLAAAYAEAIGAGSVWIGLIDAAGGGLSDTSPAFVRALELAIELGSKCGAAGNRIRLEMPLTTQTKEDVMDNAERWGLDPKKLWSCYLGGEKPCGACTPCRVRAETGRFALRFR